MLKKQIIWYSLPLETKTIFFIFLASLPELVAVGGKARQGKVRGASRSAVVHCGRRPSTGNQTSAQTCLLLHWGTALHWQKLQSGTKKFSVQARAPLPGPVVVEWRRGVVQALQGTGTSWKPHLIGQPACLISPSPQRNLKYSQNIKKGPIISKHLKGRLGSLRLQGGAQKHQSQKIPLSVFFGQKRPFLRKKFCLHFKKISQCKI